MAVESSILVLGAGELGNAVLRALTSHLQRNNTSVTVLLRSSSIDSSDPTKKTQISKLRNLGVAFLHGDIVNVSEASLAALFKPFGTIIGCTGMTHPAGTQHKIVRAVLAAGTRRYIPWQFGFDYNLIGHGSSQDLFSEQLSVRHLLRQQSSTDWIIVSTGVFMSFLAEASFGVVDVEQKIVRALGSWENRITATSVEDIGRVVAEIIYAAPEVKGVVYTAGDTLSYANLAEVVDSISSQAVARELWSVEKLKSDLIQDSDNSMKKYRVVIAEGKGVAWDPTKTFNFDKDLILQDFKTWMTRHAR